MQNMSGVFSSIQEQSAGGFQTAIFKIRKSAAYTISCTNIFWNGTNKFMNSILKTVQLLIEGNGKVYEYGRCVLKQTTYEEEKKLFSDHLLRPKALKFSCSTFSYLQT